MNNNVEFYIPRDKKIRGFTELVLDNGRERKVVESENTFYASNIAPFLQETGQARTSYKNFNWTNLVGGIFLFNKTIPNNSEYMPAGTKMTGNGSYNVSNDGNPIELGTFISYSKPTSDSLEMNYTWDTSHGNGIVNSVCLTSALGGLIGYGNPSGTHTSTPSPYYQEVSNAYFNPSIDGRGYHYKGFIYSGYVASNTLTLTRKPYGLNYIDIFNSSTIQKTVETHSSGTPTPGLGQNGKIFFFDPCRSGTWEIGGQSPCGLIIYDIDTDTVTESYLTNNTGYRWTSNGGGAPFYGIAGVDEANHRLFIGDRQSTPNYIFLIDYQDSSLIKTFDNRYLRYRKATPELFVVGSAGDSTSTFHSIYDPVNDTTYVQNGCCPFVDGNNNAGYICEYNDDEDMFCQCDTYWEKAYPNPSYLFFGSPFYLATINNLQSPISKTDSDILQVKYTLTAS